MTHAAQPPVTPDTASANGPALPSAPAQPQGAASEQQLSVVVVEDPGQLAEHVPAWDDLAAAAVEPNVFYESWMLLPALHGLGAGKRLRIVLIFAPERSRPSGTPLLCGLFPLETHSRHKGLPVRTTCLWQHDYCYLCTPLLRTGYTRQALEAFFEWLAQDPQSGPLMEFPTVLAEGPFHHLMVDLLRERRNPTLVNDCYTRAFFQPRADAESYIRAAISGDQRRNLKRKEKRLAEQGRLEYRELQADGDVEAWVSDFLQMEASGWKGRQGSALGCNEAARTFFQTIATTAFRQGRLLMLALCLDGRPIAQRCNFLSGQGAFFFKPCFDERYGRFSPGLLLEIETIRRLHAKPMLRWMDSCTSPDNFMLNDLWLDRRTIQTILLATGRRPGGFLIAVLPFLKWLRRRLRIADCGLRIGRQG